MDIGSAIEHIMNRINGVDEVRIKDRRVYWDVWVKFINGNEFSIEYFSFDSIDSIINKIQKGMKFNPKHRFKTHTGKVPEGDSTVAKLWFRR